MTASIKELRTFFTEPEYTRLQEELLSELRIDSAGEPDDVLCKLDLRGLTAAEMTLSQVKDTLYIDYEKIKKYVLEKMHRLDDMPDEQEYPDDELPDEDDIAHENESRELGGAPINFLFGHLVEYALMSSKPERLMTYLKAIGIPLAGKFRKELLECFSISQTH